MFLNKTDGTITLIHGIAISDDIIILIKKMPKHPLFEFISEPVGTFPLVLNMSISEVTIIFKQVEHEVTFKFSWGNAILVH